MKVGIAQICSGSDRWMNLDLVSKLIKEAEQVGCELICFPENVFYRGTRKGLDSELILDLSERRLKAESDFSRKLTSVLASTSLAVSLGSVLERSADSSRPFNSHWFVFPDKTITSYQKIHLFTFAGSNAVYDEGKNVTPGKSTCVVEFGGFHIGLSICYDLRFPELYRELSVRNGADVFLVPSAFTWETGKAHWHTLLRCRAIENLSYVIASAQWGEHQSEEGKKLSCFGHSLAYAPWGETLSEAPETGNNLSVITLDQSSIQKRRKQLGVFQSVRLMNSI